MIPSPSTLTPPGQKIAISSADIVGKISFKDKYPKVPLPPVVEATYFTETKQIKISAVVFLEEAIVNPAFEVYQHYEPYVTGEPFIKFYVAYTFKETEAENFNAYQVNFIFEPSAAPGSTPDMITEIETFLWDTDPKASRGTVTNVQRN
jgi:hypothetical protein